MVDVVSSVYESSDQRHISDAPRPPEESCALLLDLLLAGKRVGISSSQLLSVESNGLLLRILRSTDRIRSRVLERRCSLGGREAAQSSLLQPD